MDSDNDTVEFNVAEELENLDLGQVIAAGLNAVNLPIIPAEDYFVNLPPMEAMPPLVPVADFQAALEGDDDSSDDDDSENGRNYPESWDHDDGQNPVWDADWEEPILVGPGDHFGPQRTITISCCGCFTQLVDWSYCRNVPAERRQVIDGFVSVDIESLNWDYEHVYTHIGGPVFCGHCNHRFAQQINELAICFVIGGGVITY